MRRYFEWASLTLVSTLLLSAACQHAGNVRADHHESDAVHHAIAVMTPTAGNTAKGTVTLAAVDGGVRVTAAIEGLEPGSTHAIHIHELGDISDPAGKATGGHYNPEGHDHALPEVSTRHAGDLGNLTADDTGKASYTITVDNVTLDGAKNPVLGRGVIVHAGEDDGGQPTGNAGARIAQGVIGIAKAD